MIGLKSSTRCRSIQRDSCYFQGAANTSSDSQKEQLFIAVFVFSSSTRWRNHTPTDAVLRTSDASKHNLDRLDARLFCELVEWMPLGVLVELSIVPFIFRQNHPAIRLFSETILMNRDVLWTLLM